MIALDNGYQEAVAIVADAGASADRLCDALGFARVHAGAAAPGLLALLGLNPGEGWHEVLIGQPECDRGHLRLLSRPGRPARPRRLGAQPWDIGGWFDAGVRSLGSIDAALERLTLQGFVAFAPVADFNMGGFEVREVLAHDADGLCFALAERVAPPLAGYEHVRGPISNLFNSVIAVTDLRAAVDMFVSGLGWQALVDTALVHGDGRNVMGLPLDIAGTREVKLAIVQQQGRMEGSVELIEYPCEGLDFTAAAPDARGLAGFCFPVSDLDAAAARAQAIGWRVSPVEGVVWAPHGDCRAASILTPWGARMLFLQPTG
jgi:catechol 2,3-dioxygenase-like lactoylglutathione lyase family enzyme